MANKRDMVFTGDKALVKALLELSKPSTVNKVMRPGFREASGKIRMAAKRLAPVKSGQLKKSIKNVVRTGKHGVYAVIGPAHGFKTVVDGRPNDPVMYAHLVEFGTTHSAPNPFLRPAMDGTDSKSIIAGRVRIELAKEAARVARKAGKR